MSNTLVSGRHEVATKTAFTAPGKNVNIVLNIVETRGGNYQILLKHSLQGVISAHATLRMLTLEALEPSIKYPTEPWTHDLWSGTCYASRTDRQIDFGGERHENAHALKHWVAGIIWGTQRQEGAH